MTITILAWSSKLDRQQFDCGVAPLDDWLVRHAGQFERRHLARTFVAVVEGETRVVGYYSLLTHHVQYENLSLALAKGLPRLDIPVVLLGKLAVDRSRQGQGIGALLLVDALKRVTRIANEVGVRGVEVDAINDSARQFYLKYGFHQLIDDENHLFLSINTLNQLPFDF